MRTKIITTALLIALVPATAQASTHTSHTRHRVPRTYSVYNTNVYRGQMTKMRSALGIHYHTYTPKHSKKY